MAKKSDKKGGGKLSRSETVTVRLDAELRYLVELAKRKQRRTVSSYIEWATEESLSKIPMTEDPFEGPVMLSDHRTRLWDTDEADRFVKLAMNFPSLLTYQEQILWKLIRENGYVWPQGKKGSLDLKKVREKWEDFQKVARGDANKSILPNIDKTPEEPQQTDTPQESLLPPREEVSA